MFAWFDFASILVCVFSEDLSHHAVCFLLIFAELCVRGTDLCGLWKNEQCSGSADNVSGAHNVCCVLATMC